MGKLIILLVYLMGMMIPQAYALMPGGYGSLYPQVLSQPIDILPSGTITLIVGPETYYYANGVFFQKVILEQKYVMVPPPIGAVVFHLPLGYKLMLIDGITFYEYQGVFYKRVLDGYKVIYPLV